MKVNLSNVAKALMVAILMGGWVSTPATSVTTSQWHSTGGTWEAVQSSTGSETGTWGTTVTGDETWTG